MASQFSLAIGEISSDLPESKVHLLLARMFENPFLLLPSAASQKVEEVDLPWEGHVPLGVHPPCCRGSPARKNSQLVLMLLAGNEGGKERPEFLPLMPSWQLGLGCSSDSPELHQQNIFGACAMPGQWGTSVQWELLKRFHL